MTAMTAYTTSTRSIPLGGRTPEKRPAYSARNAGKYSTAATIAITGERRGLRNRRTSATMASASPAKSRPKTAKPRPVTFATGHVSRPAGGVRRMSQTMYAAKATARILAAFESFIPLSSSLIVSTRGMPPYYLTSRYATGSTVIRRQAKPTRAFDTQPLR
jgi:hypothetical protein